VKKVLGLLIGVGFIIVGIFLVLESTGQINFIDYQP
jgi:hypothetical protein